MELDGRVRIVRVTPESPAQEAGLRAGDWIAAVDGEVVRTLEGFYKRIWAHAAGAGGLGVTVLEEAGTRVVDVPVRERGSRDGAAAGDLACFEARGIDRTSDCCGVRSALSARRR